MENKSDAIYAPFAEIDKAELNGIIKKDSYIAVMPEINSWFKKVITPKSFDEYTSQKRIVKLAERNVPKKGATIKAFIPCPDDPEFLTKKLIPYINEWPDIKKTIVMIPRYSPSCQSEFNKLPDELKENLKFAEFHAEIVPLAPRVFVTPIERAYFNLFCNDDISDVYTISRALAKLTMIVGKPQMMFAAGAVSTRVFKLLTDMQNNIGSSLFQEDGAFSKIIILDRNVDKLSPFMTSDNYADKIQAAYKGKLDVITLPDGTKIDLDDNDPIYDVIKKYSFSKAINYVTTRVQEAKSVERNIDDIRAQAGTKEFKFTANRTKKIIQTKPYLEKHLDLIEKNIKATSLYINKLNIEQAIIDSDPDTISEEEILDMIRRKEYITAIKYLILRSYAGNGLPESLIKKVALTFNNFLGYKFYSEFMNLFESGLIRQKQGMFSKDDLMPSNQINDLLQLTIQPRTELSGVVSDYFIDFVPILVRLVDEALKNKWMQGTPGEKVLSGLKIPFVAPDPRIIQQKPIEPEERVAKPFHRILVYVIGGVTPAECEMLQDIGNIFYTDKNYTYEVHVASTAITNGDQLIESVCPSLASI